MSGMFGALGGEFTASTRLFLKLDLPLERETILHFFDLVRKSFPMLSKFRRREDGCLILEEVEREDGSRRWVRLDPTSLRFGCHSPESPDVIREMGEVILEHAPYHLTFSELDFDRFEVLYGFELEYRGNHDQLLAEIFWANHPLSALVLSEDSYHTIDAQPYFGVALTANCDLQAYFEVKSRTSTYEVRTGNYEPQPLSVFLTLRRYWGFTTEPAALVATHQQLVEIANKLAAERAVPLLVNPLAHAIASRM